MIKDFKNSNNVRLSYEESNIYGNVDGLSLQNLFYTKNGCFPNCFLFDYDSRNNAQYYFDTKKMAEYILENIKEEIEMTTYYTKTLGSKDNKTILGFCVILKESNIYARFEESITDSYVLYDNNHVKELENFVNQMVQFYVAPEVKENRYWRICSSQSGYYLDEGKIKCPQNFNVDALYNDDFKKEDEKISKFIEKDDESGLIILHGEKGTGKSTYIKNLVSKFPNRKFVYLPASLVRLLGDPSLGSFLTSLNNHVIILEDCENALKSREKELVDSSSVALLLNMTDGILADDLGLKFICTFNTDMRNIDNALLRKGRLVSKYEFKGLCVDKANKILEERGIEGEVDKPTSLADLFHFEEDSYELIRKSII